MIETKTKTGIEVKLVPAPIKNLVYGDIKRVEVEFTHPSGELLKGTFGPEHWRPEGPGVGVTLNEEFAGEKRLILSIPKEDFDAVIESMEKPKKEVRQSALRSRCGFDYDQLDAIDMG